MRYYLVHELQLQHFIPQTRREFLGNVILVIAHFDFSGIRHGMILARLPVEMPVLRPGGCIW
jgi:hypothetical protein